jgi:hypothetical protein
LTNNSNLHDTVNYIAKKQINRRINKTLQIDTEKREKEHKKERKRTRNTKKKIKINMIMIILTWFCMYIYTGGDLSSVGR